MNGLFVKEEYDYFKITCGTLIEHQYNIYNMKKEGGKLGAAIFKVRELKGFCERRFNICKTDKVFVIEHNLYGTSQH